eukprot:g227.t1
MPRMTRSRARKQAEAEKKKVDSVKKVITSSLSSTATTTAQVESVPVQQEHKPAVISKSSSPVDTTKNVTKSKLVMQDIEDEALEEEEELRREEHNRSSLSLGNATLVQLPDTLPPTIDFGEMPIKRQFSNASNCDGTIDSADNEDDEESQAPRAPIPTAAAQLLNDDDNDDLTNGGRPNGNSSRPSSSSTLIDTPINNNDDGFRERPSQQIIDETETPLVQESETPLLAPVHFSAQQPSRQLNGIQQYGTQFLEQHQPIMEATNGEEDNNEEYLPEDEQLLGDQVEGQDVNDNAVADNGAEDEEEDAARKLHFSQIDIEIEDEPDVSEELKANSEQLTEQASEQETNAGEQPAPESSEQPAPESSELPAPESTEETDKETLENKVTKAEDNKKSNKDGKTTGANGESLSRSVQVFLKIRPNFLPNESDGQPPKDTLKPIINTNKENENNKNATTNPKNVVKKMSNTTITAGNSTSVQAFAPVNSQAYRNGERFGVFDFSQVFGTSTNQSSFYENAARPAVESLLQGNLSHALLFAYGMTNAGKTYTIQGSEKNPGIIPRALEQIFHQDSSLTQGSSENHDSVKLAVSYLEIYQDSVYDLLAGATVPPTTGEAEDQLLSSNSEEEQNKRWTLKGTKKKLRVRGRGDVQGLMRCNITSAQEGMNLLKLGKERREVARTNMNSTSSRSHSIFTMRIVTSKNNRDLKLTTRELSVVDLAGSERGVRTRGCKQRVAEASKINQSLMHLMRCLTIMRQNVASVERWCRRKEREMKKKKLQKLQQEEKKQEGSLSDATMVKKNSTKSVTIMKSKSPPLQVVPFRSTALTHVLQRSLEHFNFASVFNYTNNNNNNNHSYNGIDKYKPKTLVQMIINASPEGPDYDETLHALKYAALAQEIRTLDPKYSNLTNSLLNNNESEGNGAGKNQPVRTKRYVYDRNGRRIEIEVPIDAGMSSNKESTDSASSSSNEVNGRNQTTKGSTTTSVFGKKNVPNLKKKRSRPGLGGPKHRVLKSSKGNTTATTTATVVTGRVGLNNRMKSTKTTKITNDGTYNNTNNNRQIMNFTTEEEENDENSASSLKRRRESDYGEIEKSEGDLGNVKTPQQQSSDNENSMLLDERREGEAQEEEEEKEADLTCEQDFHLVNSGVAFDSSSPSSSKVFEDNDQNDDAEERVARVNRLLARREAMVRDEVAMEVSEHLADVEARWSKRLKESVANAEREGRKKLLKFATRFGLVNKLDKSGDYHGSSATCTPEKKDMIMKDQQQSSLSKNSPPTLPNDPTNESIASETSDNFSLLTDEIESDEFVGTTAGAAGCGGRIITDETSDDIGMKSMFSASSMMNGPPRRETHIVMDELDDQVIECEEEMVRMREGYEKEIKRLKALLGDRGDLPSVKEEDEEKAVSEKVTKLEKKLADTNDELTKLSQEYLVLSATLEQTKTELVQNQNGLTTALKTNQELEDKLRSDSSSFTKRETKYTNEIKDYVREIGALQRLTDEQSSQLDDVESQLQTIAHEKKTLHKRFKKQQDSMEKSIAIRLKNQSIQIEEKLKIEYKAKLHEKDQRISKLQARIAGLSTKNRSLNARITSLIAEKIDSHPENSNKTNKNVSRNQYHHQRRLRRAHSSSSTSSTGQNTTAASSKMSSKGKQTTKTKMKSQQPLSSETVLENEKKNTNNENELVESSSSSSTTTNVVVEQRQQEDSAVSSPLPLAPSTNSSENTSSNPNKKGLFGSVKKMWAKVSGQSGKKAVRKGKKRKSNEIPPSTENFGKENASTSISGRTRSRKPRLG